MSKSWELTEIQERDRNRPNYNRTLDLSSSHRLTPEEREFAVKWSRGWETRAYQFFQQAYFSQN